MNKMAQPSAAVLPASRLSTLPLDRNIAHPASQSTPLKHDEGLQDGVQHAPVSMEDRNVHQLMDCHAMHCYAAGTVSAKVESFSIAAALKTQLKSQSSSGASNRNQDAEVLNSDVLYALLSQTENRHLAREIEWVLSIDGVAVYQLMPHSEASLDELIASLSPLDNALDRHIAVGRLSEEPIGFEKLPQVDCHHLMLKKHDFLVDGIATALKKYRNRNGFDKTLLAEKVIQPILSHTYNLGLNDAERALTYACWNYPDLYAVAYHMVKGGFDNDSHDSHGFSLEDIFYEPYRLQGQQQIYQIVFEFKGNSSNVISRWFCRVDASADYPTLQHGMQRYHG